LNKGSVLINKEYDSDILKTIIKRYWWWPVLFVFAFSTAAYFSLRYTVAIYESSMIIQLGNNDNAKELINVENINSKENDISSEIELMRSQFLFEKAIKRINYNVSLFSKGNVLTRKKSCFKL